jgi:hypothetical protein
MIRRQWNAMPEAMRTEGTVVAMAGRRVDGPAAVVPRFPPERSGKVGEELRRVLPQLGARWLVSAAACGADILALEAATALGIRRRVVLPDRPEIFRQTSVIDRTGDLPGGWGDRFDRIIAGVVASRDLVVLPPPGAGEDIFFNANLAILDEAQRIAAAYRWPLLALVVWNGTLRGPDDVTGHFRAEAVRRGLPVHEILTTGA